ncbi:MAG: response regulator [Bacteroidota bacterium]
MATQKRKILIVEDDRAVATGLKDLLQSENYTVLVYTDGRAALRQAFTVVPDLVLLDVNLPTLGGFEVCRQLRARGYVNPVVMLTVRMEQIDKVLGLEAGADDYVTKPFDTREILARVRAQMRRFERSSQASATTAQIRGLEKYRRRLLTVMFTDIKDYSKKMNENEKLALTLLKIHNDKMNRTVTRHGGRVVEIIGDAFLVSFESAVKAVQCAVAIQQDFKTYNRTKPRKEHILVRIGIHLGDIVEFEGKLKGDTINIAARIQQFSTAGRVSISDSVFNAIKNKIHVKTASLGERRIKNIKQPVKVYRLSV